MNIHFYKKKVYELAFIERVAGTKYSDCQWQVRKVVNPYQKEKWFADPFILGYDEDKVEVLVEEMDYTIRRGRIAKLIIDRIDYTIKDVKILLDLPTHLSFPAIRRVGNEVFVYPENSVSGALNLYKYNYDTQSLDVVHNIINQPLTDTIIKDIDGAKYIFSTAIPDPNGSKLKIYKESTGTAGGFELFQEYQFTDKTARGAGDWFEEEGKIIRPAQDCNGYYGVGLVFQRVTFENEKFVFSEISRLRHPKGYDGMHTFNIYCELCIIDYRRPLYPYIYYPLLSILKLLKKIR